MRRRHDIAASVVPPVLLQSVQSSGRRHELPQPRRALARVRVHLEGALDHRQQRELGGQLLLLDFAHDVRQVRSRPSRQTLEVLGVVPVPLDLALDPWMQRMRQRQAAANACPCIGPFRSVFARLGVRRPDRRDAVERDEFARLHRIRAGTPGLPVRLRPFERGAAREGSRAVRSRFGQVRGGVRISVRVRCRRLRRAPGQDHHEREEGGRQPCAHARCGHSSGTSRIVARRVIGRAGVGRHVSIRGPRGGLQCYGVAPVRSRT